MMTAAFGGTARFGERCAAAMAATIGETLPEMSNRRSSGGIRWLAWCALTALVAADCLNGVSAQWLQAAPQQVVVARYRAVHHFDGMHQTAVGLRFPSPALQWQVGSTRGGVDLLVTTGEISRNDSRHAFLAVGPALRWYLSRGTISLFLDVGTQPTLLDGSVFAGEDLGGDFHFTSHASAGLSFGRDNTLTTAFGVQHISNGELRAVNPGVDMIGFTLDWRLP